MTTDDAKAKGVELAGVNAMTMMATRFVVCKMVKAAFTVSAHTSAIATDHN